MFGIFSARFLQSLHFICVNEIRNPFSVLLTAAGRTPSPSVYHRWFFVDADPVRRTLKSLSQRAQKHIPQLPPVRIRYRSEIREYCDASSSPLPG